ncbi:MAG: tRNA adenosine(34) deaminase TadA [Gammaproteobacteria bacterium]|nr:tRNA adenosine(34) deaminase TadA [Gammaproteobacteria bacterium]
MSEPGTDEHWMAVALDLARAAGAGGEVPVGAVVVIDGVLAGSGYNAPIARSDPSAHAEIIALREAAQGHGNYRLPGAVVYATLEPCVMCAGTLVHARVARLVFGAPDPRAGAAGSVFDIFGSTRLNHAVAVTGGVLEGPCRDLLQAFFRARRART